MLNTTEVLKEIASDPEYSISNLGRVTGKLVEFLKPFVTKQGYLAVTLCTDGRRHNRFVHVLVAEAFLGPRPPGKQVNHKSKSGDKTDNRVENLEWATPSENEKHSYDVLGKASRKGSKHGEAKLTTADIPKIRHLALGGMSQREIGEKFGVTHTTISAVVNRKLWKHVA